MTHNPLTCKDCSPEPWAQTEITTGGHTRRYTGWAAVAMVMGPFMALAFMLGVLVAVLVVT